MIFTDITIANFFSVTDQIKLELKDQGLVLISGENHDSSAADSNGSGKSTIFEALLWCLWGKTVRGQSGDEVVNRNAKKECYVITNMVDGQSSYTVCRYRNHPQFKNGLQLCINGADVSEGTPTLTQKKIDDLLGIDFDSFIRGPMLPQGSFKRFSQMTDSEQKTILENAIQLSILPAALEKVKEKISKETLELNKLKLTQEQLLDNLQREKEDLIRMREEKDNFLVVQMKQKASLWRQLALAYLDVDRYWDDLTLPVDVTEATNTLNKVQDLENKLKALWDQRVEDANNDFNTKMGEHRILESKLTDLLQQLGSMSTLEPGTVCPTCYQTIDGSNVDLCMAATKEEMSAVSNVAKDAFEVAQRAKKKLGEVKAERDTSLKRASSMCREALDAYGVVCQQQYAYDERERSLVKAESAIELARTRPAPNHAPLDKIVDAIVNRIDELTNNQSIGQEMIDQQTKLIDHLEFWKRGFSNAGLKSRIMSAITPFMNRQSDMYIRDLTDGELQIEFSTQTTLKSGQTREQFSVEVKNKNGAASYEGSSGGEKARADLAINFTLSDLVASRSKKSYPQRWFDEPFESLDEAGIEAVMDLLAKMVQSCGSIFVITHQGAMKSLFNKVITVAKKNGVTTLVAS